MRLDITDRINKILNKIPKDTEDYEDRLYSEVAEELRPLGYGHKEIQLVVDTYLKLLRSAKDPLVVEGFIEGLKEGGVLDEYLNTHNIEESVGVVTDPKEKSFQQQIDEMGGNIKVSLYQAKNGHNYGEEFFQDLYVQNEKLCAKFLSVIRVFKQLGAKTPTNYSKYLQDGIFEFRASAATNEARELYFFATGGNEVIVTNGFVKKTQKTPKEEIERAKNLRDEYCGG